jgi:uncharacterized membrane protein
MMHSRGVVGVSAVIAVAAVPDHALAYIGPGAGLTVIGWVVVLFGAVLLAIVGFLWYPLKTLMGRMKRLTGDALPEIAPEPIPEAAREATRDE